MIFGDLAFSLETNSVRRGDGRDLAVSPETVELLAALAKPERHELSCVGLWKALAGVAPFEGVTLAALIDRANAELIDVDAALIVQAFTVRLADVTPRAFLRGAARAPDCGESALSPSLGRPRGGRSS
jgi:hypothetical protein